MAIDDVVNWDGNGRGSKTMQRKAAFGVSQRDSEALVRTLRGLQRIAQRTIMTNATAVMANNAQACFSAL